MHRETLIKRLLNGCAATVLVLALAGGAPLLAQAAVSKSSVSDFEKAKSHIERGDINKAVIELKNAIQADGNNTDARVQLALIYMAQGNPVGAQKEFEAAMARGFDKAAIIPALAQTYTMQGKNEELLEVYGDTVLEGKAQAALSVRRAQANLAMKDYDGARAQLALATAAAPELAEIYIVKSWLLQAEGDFSRAETAIDRALVLSDDGAEALMQKAELMRLQGDLPQAVDLATRSLDKNPYRREVRITRGLANAGLNKVDAALEDAEALIERNKADPFGAFLKAWAHSQKGETKVALAALVEGRSVESYPPALYLAAALHLKAGQLEQARQKINIFLSKAPTSIRGLVTSAAIHYQTGNFDAARDVLVPLYEADKNDVRVVTMLAYAYEQSGERGKAAALFDEATMLDPSNESLRFRSAEAKIGSGDIESALEELAGLADSATGGERAATLSFLTQLREKKYSGAEKAIDKLVSINGITAKSENFRASIALNKGDLSIAKGHLKKSLSLDETYVPGRLNLARLLQLQKDVEEAKGQYKTLLKQIPGYLPAIDGLVKIARATGDDKEAARLLASGVKNNPGSERAHLDQINHYLSKSDGKKALRLARDFKSSLPDNLNAYDAMARAQIILGQTTAAAANYRQLTGLTPDNAAAHFRLARVLIQQESYTEAMTSLDRVLALDPSQIGSKRIRVELEKQVYGDERAERLAREIFTDVVGDANQKTELGRSLMTLGKQQEGLRLIEQAYQATKKRAQLLAIFGAYDKVGRRDDATGVLAAWVGDNPDQATIRAILFSRYITIGAYDKAVTEGETLLAASSEDAVVLNNLAWLYEQDGQIEEALSHGKKALALAPGSAEIGDTYGWILLEHGDGAEAERVLRQAAERVPDRRDIQYHHAVSMVSVGKTAGAIKKLKKILATDGDFPGRSEAASLLGELE